MTADGSAALTASPTVSRRVTTMRDPRPAACRHGGLHQHGTRACYVFDECGCTPCRDANRHYLSERAQLLDHGRWAPLVDAGPVVVHVQALLEAGLSRTQVAGWAGVAVSVVSKLLNRSSTGSGIRRVRVETAQRLLAVSGSDIDAAGTRRRLQALVTIGWPPALLDSELRTRAGLVERLLKARAVTILVAGQVEELFERLWDCPPPQHTPEQQQAAESARARARTCGWAPPMAWDEELNPINDPGSKPDVGEPVRRRGKLPPADELLWLLDDAGETRASLAHRFGVAETYLREKEKAARALVATGAGVERDGAAAAADGAAA